MENRKKKYWLIVASKDHVKTGIAEGIAQACHGKASPLRKMKKDDFVIYYSGRQTFDKPEKCQEFTAIGQVLDDEVFQLQLTENFSPSRKKIEFFNSEDVSILPMINDLDFIRNKKRWGAPFRFGFLEIPKNDFKLIYSKMLKKEYVD